VDVTQGGNKRRQGKASHRNQNRATHHPRHSSHTRAPQPRTDPTPTPKPTTTTQPRTRSPSTRPTPPPPTALTPHHCRRPATPDRSAPRQDHTPRKHMVGRGRGSGAKRRTPFLAKAQAESQRNTRGRGGGLLRSWKKPKSETDGGKHKERNKRPVGDQLLLLPRRLCPWPTTSPARARRSSSGGGPEARPAQLRGRLP
jgi:hypothetical protein